MATLHQRLDALTNVALMEIYNSVSERQVSKFSDHTTTVKRVEAAIQAAKKDLIVTGARTGPYTWRLVDQGTEVREGRARIITVLAEGNPKVKGSKSARRFALYRSGMTIQEYVDAVGKLRGEPNPARKAIRDVEYDVAHGYIRVG